MYNPNFLDFLIRSIIIILINFISFVNVICFVSLNQKKIVNFKLNSWPTFNKVY